MGRYSVSGSRYFDQKIDQDMQTIITAVRNLIPASELRAIILTGGYGRGEGTAYLSQGKEFPFNDYDMVVVASQNSLNLRKKLHLLEKDLSKKVGLPVDLYLHTPRSLKRSEHSLMNTEMLHGHSVVYGDRKTLQIMPSFSVETLPLEEGSRLLLNRGKLLLDMEQRFKERKALSDEERLHFAKFLLKSRLAYGDCLFMAAKDYTISYASKSQEIGNLIETFHPPHAKEIERDFKQGVAFKNSGESSWLNSTDLKSQLARQKVIFHDFTLWFESQRMRTSIASLEEYETLLPRKGRGPILLQAKALYHNYSSQIPLNCFAFVHPRLRLLLALLELLSEGAVTNELLGDGDTTERFYALRERFA